MKINLSFKEQKKKIEENITNWLFHSISNKKYQISIIFSLSNSNKNKTL